jgi:hypothetical protein
MVPALLPFVHSMCLLVGKRTDPKFTDGLPLERTAMFAVGALAASEHYPVLDQLNILLLGEYQKQSFEWLSATGREIILQDSNVTIRSMGEELFGIRAGDRFDIEVALSAVLRHRTGGKAAIVRQFDTLKSILALPQQRNLMDIRDSVDSLSHGELWYPDSWEGAKIAYVATFGLSLPQSMGWVANEDLNCVVCSGACRIPASMSPRADVLWCLFESARETRKIELPPPSECRTIAAEALRRSAEWGEPAFRPNRPLGRLCRFDS